ncbi:MAG: glycine/sarcosine/betaine reductase complex component C subunit beta [Ezakiella sp.]|nr:glycine/sarcosine/betaine reductase complex component C subunit beta [Bacillota bacterium]MDY3946605.1 glycine/sarcosine/betaine reductase complex component C subunit beta [Ezakiella sp.]
MSFSVNKGSSYVLMHCPDMVLHNGTTQTSAQFIIDHDKDEAKRDAERKYLESVPSHLRSFEEAVSYYPNQIYIGNERPEVLADLEMPWTNHKMENADRHGKYGEIMPQDEFIAMIKIVDVFDLVLLEAGFNDEVKKKMEAHPLVSDELVAKLKDGVEQAKIDSLIENEHSEPLIFNGKAVGCVKRAHDIDANLSAHVMFENLVSKASGVMAALHCIDKNGFDPLDIEYVVECSEEACGDMNQRGGGNFAKAIAEFAGLKNASGSDTRGFCAAPTHALVVASSLVASGTYKNVLVVAGGSTAKLGMNGKDHVKKGLPIIEDCVAGFATIIGENDGKNPIMRNDIVGRHTVGTGSAPQAVISSLVTDPLDKAGLKITDIDKYSVEMQNPDITKPAGAGDVPEANYKMIGALAVKSGVIEKTALPTFAKTYGVNGWAPTQGHIPSGVPYLGFLREDMLEGKINRAMIVGKGSLFLGRMTNLFDGTSIVIERNTGKTEESAGASTDEDTIKKYVAEAMREFAAAFKAE